MTIELILGKIDILSLKEVAMYGGAPINYEASAIVNAANKNLEHGGGLAWYMSRQAGGSFQQDGFDLVKEHPLDIGEVIAQDGGSSGKPKYNLPSRYVIHAVGPAWEDDTPKIQRQQLKDAYTNALKLAEDLKLDTIALPGISIGIFGFPHDQAAKIVQEVLDGFEYNHIKRVILCYRDETLPAFLKNTTYKEGKQTIGK